MHGESFNQWSIVQYNLCNQLLNQLNEIIIFFHVITISYPFNSDCCVIIPMWFYTVWLQCNFCCKWVCKALKCSCHSLYYTADLGELSFKLRTRLIKGAVSDSGERLASWLLRLVHSEVVKYRCFGQRPGNETQQSTFFLQNHSPHLHYKKDDEAQFRNLGSLQPY